MDRLQIVSEFIIAAIRLTLINSKLKQCKMLNFHLISAHFAIISLTRTQNNPLNWMQLIIRWIFIVEFFFVCLSPSTVTYYRENQLASIALMFRSCITVVYKRHHFMQRISIENQHGNTIHHSLMLFHWVARQRLFSWMLLQNCGKCAQNTHLLWSLYRIVDTIFEREYSLLFQAMHSMHHWEKQTFFANVMINRSATIKWVL